METINIEQAVNMANPKRGEIWLVKLNPTRGQEMRKTRPVVVISSDLFSSKRALKY